MRFTTLLVCVLLPAAWAAAPSAAAVAGARHFEDLSAGLPDEPLTAVAVDPDNEDRIFVGMDGFLWKSNDGGATFRPVLAFPRGSITDDTDFDVRNTGAADNDMSGVGGSDDTGDDHGNALDEVDADTDTTDDNEDEDDLPEGTSFTDAQAADDSLPDGAVADAFDVDDVLDFPRAAPGVRQIVFVSSLPTDATPSARTMYIATSRGLFRGSTTSDAFVAVEVPGEAFANDIRALATDPDVPSRLYLGTADGLLVTHDGGSTFDHASEPVGALPVQALATARIGGVTHVVVGTERGLFRSVDAGISFFELMLRGAPPQPPITAVAIGARGETLFAGTALGVFTAERQAAVLEIYGGVTATTVTMLLGHPDAPASVAVGARGRGVLLSSDAGLSTDPAADNVPANEVLGLARSPQDAEVLWVACERGLFVSLPGSGVTVGEAGVEKIKAAWRQEPALTSVMTDALRYARLDRDIYGDMRSRAFWAALLPKVGAQAAYGQVTLLSDFSTRTVADLPIGTEPADDEVDVLSNGAFVSSGGTALRTLAWITLRWDLDRVVFHPQVLGTLRAQPRLQQEQRRILNRAQKLYVERRRRMLARPPADDYKRALWQLEIEQLTAELDGMTGGNFSAARSADVELEDAP